MPILLCLLLAPPPADLSGAYQLTYLGQSAGPDAEPQRWGFVTLERDTIRADVYHLTRYSPEFVVAGRGLLKQGKDAWTGTLPVGGEPAPTVWHWDGRGFAFSDSGWLYFVRK
jgi:hypothetical protein